MRPRNEEALLPAAALKGLLRYEPETGHLFWLERDGSDRGTRSFNARFAGKRTGSLVASGYLSVVISIDGKHKHFRAHRIAWCLATGAWPPANIEIDHRNNVRSDNRRKNLRLALHVQNGASKRLAKNNTSGFKGVTFRANLPKPWKAQIRRNGKKVSLGYFATPECAARAYDAAASDHFGDFARTNASMGLL